MPTTQASGQRKGGKNLTTSPHRKERYGFYKANVYAKNKLKRILQSCGIAAAQIWARAHTAELVLQKLMKNA